MTTQYHSIYRKCDNIRLPLGEIIITPSALSILSPDDIKNAIIKHSRGDWGIEDKDSRRGNEVLLNSGRTVGSIHRAQITEIKYFVFTNGNRNKTIVILSNEKCPF